MFVPPWRSKTLLKIAESGYPPKKFTKKVCKCFWPPRGKNIFFAKVAQMWSSLRKDNKFFFIFSVNRGGGQETFLSQKNNHVSKSFSGHLEHFKSFFSRGGCTCSCVKKFTHPPISSLQLKKCYLVWCERGP